MADKCYVIDQIEPGFWAITEGGVRMYLLEGEEFALLIDTGFGGGDLLGAVRELTDKPIRVFMTHGHVDHVANCKQFDDYLLHEKELADVKPNCPEGARFEFLSDGDELTVGKWNFTVMNTPGHTPGSLCLWEKEKNFIFSGDYVGERPIFTFLPGAELEAYESSLLRLALAVGDGVFYTCHGGMVKKADTAERLICCCEGIKRGGIENEIITLYDGKKQRVFRYRDVAMLY